MATRAARLVRQRKLSTKHPLQIVRENEIETFAIDEDPQRHIPHVETGVEKAEETEHHLQAVISASAAASLGGKVSQVYIPTPESKSSSIPYEQLYPRHFSSPQTYIRFSSTVEDCVGAPYCLDEEDDVFLLNLNQAKKDGDGKCTEDLFEEVMSFFERRIVDLQPQRSIDAPPPPPYNDFEATFDDEISLDARKWAKEIYDHWRTRRLQKGNRDLMPTLKFETGAETDDNDAYVTFRRREVRQARKTRGRDAQVVEKLKKLRRELEDARQLVNSVNQRERLNKERIAVDRKVFEQRSELKRVKIQQGIKSEKGEDEELLVNQKPAPKPSKTKGESGQRPPTLRLSTNRSDGRAPENDLIQLSDIQEDTAATIERFVQEKIGKHRQWNTAWIDNTWGPITPPADTVDDAGFLPRLEEVQLPTPPASLHSEHSGDNQQKDVEMKDADLPTPVSTQEQPLRTMFRFASPPPDPHDHSRPAFRRRFGRGGRLFIEERRSRPFVQNRGIIYDSDDESDGETPVYPIDCYDTLGLNYRASLLTHPQRRPMDAQEHAARRAMSSGDVSMANGHGHGQSTAGNPPSLLKGRSSSGS